MNSFKVWSKDYRNDVSDAIGGCYYVQKKNIIAQFSWGKSGSFDNVNEAHDALTSYLEGRKDANKLFVNLLEFEN